MKLKQVLLNLITNAIKFSHPGGRVLIRGTLEEDGLRIQVIDHGIGMDEAEIETAITRFGQVASTWNRRHPGTGLGLPLAIGLVELHGGRILIDSEKGVGTTVTICLPRKRTLALQHENKRARYYSGVYISLFQGITTSSYRFFR